MDHDKRFRNLNAKECAEVFPSVIDNAERHFSVAHQIATINEYPNAVAHLVIGAEELVKATLLLFRSRSIPVKNFTGYNLQLGSGQNNSLLKDFFSFWLGIREILDLRKAKHEYTLKEMFNMLVIGVSGIVKGKEHYYWWGRADGLKEKSLYVDFRNELILPDVQISKSDYNQAYHHVYTFRYEFYLLYHKLINASAQELAEFREQLEDAEFVELLGETLKRRKMNLLS
ncbi:hypothetical protein [Pedobacter sp. JY14-1]|uniref:hypothetical protein n=1 Tax=Pedobacter sp. JY14-1 TaxID=3034151 RepID=UPI0023E1FB50|nr:hypothetical protein [Pedobacter sp. JY14-1]